jgi:hypothetical protein
MEGTALRRANRAADDNGEKSPSANQESRQQQNRGQRRDLFHGNQRNERLEDPRDSKRQPDDKFIAITTSKPGEAHMLVSEAEGK